MELPPILLQQLLQALMLTAYTQKGDGLARGSNRKSVAQLKVTHRDFRKRKAGRTLIVTESCGYNVRYEPNPPC